MNLLRWLERNSLLVYATILQVTIAVCLSASAKLTELPEMGAAIVFFFIALPHAYEAAVKSHQMYVLKVDCLRAYQVFLALLSVSSSGVATYMGAHHLWYAMLAAVLFTASSFRCFCLSIGIVFNKE